MNCLLVGAGAVGQVYGRHLNDGGANVTFMTKPKYAAAARDGFPLYPLNEGDVRLRPVRFSSFDVVTTTEHVAAREWDCVVLCTSSTALRGGTWFSELAAVIGDATVVMLTVGLEDAAFVSQHVAPDRVVTGLIGMMSYAAPLPGETVVEPGTAYWFPPRLVCPFSGNAARVQPIVDIMKRGGFPTAKHDNVPLEGVFGSALLQTAIYALECAGWSIRALRRDRELLRSAHRAMKEASAIGAKLHDAKVPLRNRLLRPWHMGAILALANRIAPVDLDCFFEFHYTKVRDQSMDMLATWIRTADELAIACDGLRDLQRRLGEIAR